MPDLEQAVPLGKGGARRLMHLASLFMFWQGFIPEDSDHGLDYYIHQLNPRLAQFILRHRYLRLAISWYRTRHPWIMVTCVATNSMIIHPFGIYLNWGNVEIVIDNSYAMFIWGFILFGMLSELLKKNKINQLALRLGEFYKNIQLTNDVQKKLLDKSDILYIRLFKFMHFGLVPLFSSGILVCSFVVNLPAREQFFRGWYPYNQSASPAFEITLFVNGMIIVIIYAASNTLIAYVISAFLYMEVYFEIVNNKFMNIRSMSIKVIQERKLRVLQQQPRVSCRLQFGNNVGAFGNTRTRRVEMNLPGVVTQGQRSRGHATQGLCVRGLPHVSHRDLYRYENNDIDLEMRAQLAKYVGWHNDCLRMANELRDIVQYILIDIFAVSVVLYGATIMVFTNVDQLNIKMMLLFVASLEIMFLFLALSILANRITDQSAAVGEALYASDWLEASTSFKRSMLIVMTRANVPVELKPPGLDPFSTKNFGEVLSIAYKTATRLKGFLTK